MGRNLVVFGVTVTLAGVSVSSADRSGAEPTYYIWNGGAICCFSILSGSEWGGTYEKYIDRWYMSMFQYPQRIGVGRNCEPQGDRAQHERVSVSSADRSGAEHSKPDGELAQHSGFSILSGSEWGGTKNADDLRGCDLGFQYPQRIGVGRNPFQ